ncbi:hypothetical protein BJV82DRAFT_214299 [Fennellomyces sp. T-0311]|nr:hypothetical protein BJV82DRAFT_214299 [Fennellomyces sp. T-0311]
MTTHDVHRAMEENLFNSFHRHNALQSPSLAAGSSPAFRSMTASDLISLLPNTPSGQTPMQQPRNRPTSDAMHLSGHAAEEALDEWFENIQRYEKMLEEVAAASLDQAFKDELNHVNQWFRGRSDPERTAALYSVVQNASQIQIRFLITVLQQLANQDPLGELLSPAGQEKAFIARAAPAPVTVAGSVVSTESQYEMRKRQMYPPSRRATRSNLCNRLTSALSEPDDLRRRNRDMLLPRSLGLSHQQGMLYEKALAARAQIQAANNSNRSSTASSASTTSSSSASVGNGSFSGRLKTSCSTSEASSRSLFGVQGNDWPFPLARGNQEKPLVGRIGDRGSVNNDDSWSFGSLSSKKKREMDLPWTRKSDTIKEEQEYTPTQTSQRELAAATNSMTALEQAQARLRRDPTPSRITQKAEQLGRLVSASRNNLNNKHAEESKPPPSPVVTTPPPGLSPPHKKDADKQFGQFLTPNIYDPDNSNEYLSDQSDTSNLSAKDQQLTGAARRRKRSSAARALKDKLAAETVDFELMKDVQNWLRSLRLHKYSHAFDGMQWQQVVRMTDEDMLQAGVSTLGARRKLLKVFENVMRHCDEKVCS